jgi:D-xylulose reductase
MEELPMPSITDPHDVIVRIAWIGVCGSDVHWWAHGGIGSNIITPGNPLVIGHESSGVVHEVGPAVTGIRVGDHVAIEPGVPCRRCMACKRGNYHLCQQVVFAAVPPDTHGTLTKYYKSQDDYCHLLKGDGFDIDLKEGVLMEPLAVACHIMGQAGPVQGRRVAILGAGTIGILCGMVCNAYGADSIIISDISEQRRETAAKFLKCETMDPRDYPLGEDGATFLGNSAMRSSVDVVLECSGAQPALQLGIHILRLGGTIVQAGLGKPVQSIPILLLSEKEIKLKGTFRYGAGDFAEAIRLLRKGQVDVKSLISSISPFEKATDAISKTQRGEGIKNLIQGAL